MSEDKLRSEPVSGLPDPVAMGMALSRVSAGLDDELAGYLHDQRHHLHEQLKQLHLDIWEKFLGVFLRLATAVVGVAAASAVAWLIWDASNSNGLLIEPFSVPPDLATRGLTGEVVAARVLDRLTWMQSQTNTARPARSYANAWGEHGIKLEIPETGISLNELDNWLRQKLGHDLRVTGEIVRTPAGISITARAGDQGAETVNGSEGDLDTLVRQVAESVYRMTQPYRYAAYLLRHENKPAQALPIFKSLALSGSPDDRLWSYNMWGVAVGTLEGNAAGLEMYRQAVAAEPEAIGTYDNLSGSLGNIGRYEEALHVTQEELARLNDGRQRYIPGANIPRIEERIRHALERMLGAYRDALPAAEQAYRSGQPGIPAATLLNTVVTNQIGAHEISAAQNNLASFFPDADPDRLPVAFARQWGLIAAARQDWTGVRPLAVATSRYLRNRPKDKSYMQDATAPLLALAQARLGNFAEAERIIAPTADACDPCLIARGQVAELRHQPARADFWFARAAGAAPSFPFAFYEYGQVLLGRGKPDDAIGQFTAANRKSPHFADALEGWGEALMAKNQSHLALAKFEEANKYAPNWGRLHLKWGEALVYSRKPEQAKAEFARAAALDLTPSEKAELARQAPRQT